MNFTGGQTNPMLLWGAVGFALIVLVLVRMRAGKRKRARVGGGNDSDALPVLVLKRSRTVAITTAISRFSGASHVKYGGWLLQPDSVVIARSGRLRGKLPPMPKVDVNSKTSVDAALHVRQVRNVLEARQRKAEPVLIVREMDPSPYVLQEGRARNFKPRRPVGTEQARQVATAGHMKAQHDFVRNGAQGEETLKLLGWIMGLALGITFLAAASLAGFKMYLAFTA